MKKIEKLCRECGERKEEGESIGKYGFLCSECIKELNGKVKDAEVVLFGVDTEAEYNYREAKISFRKNDYGDRFLLTLNHEVTHNILHRLFGVVVCCKWDSVSPNGEYDS